MNKNNYSPYGTFSYEKVDSPRKPKNTEPKANKITSENDLRGGKKNARA
jgi:hypothetical protein